MAALAAPELCRSGLEIGESETGSLSALQALLRYQRGNSAAAWSLKRFRSPAGARRRRGGWSQRSLPDGEARRRERRALPPQGGGGLFFRLARPYEDHPLPVA